MNDDIDDYVNPGTDPDIVDVGFVLSPAAFIPSAMLLSVLILLALVKHHLVLKRLNQKHSNPAVTRNQNKLLTPWSERSKETELTSGEESIGRFQQLSDVLLTGSTRARLNSHASSSISL